MLVPIQWLKDYTDVNVSIDEFCEKMIMSGSNLETVEYFGEGFEKVVVGKVSKKEKHPDADKLSVCQVDIGQGEPVQIVCGAPNVYEGAVVPVALHKSRIPGPNNEGIKITKGKLRGVESMGMICSASELGFNEKVVPTFHKDGIWLLPQDLKLGENFEEVMGLKSPVVDFEITPNRADCLSMVGMARESAATFGEELRYPKVAPKEEGSKEAKGFIDVEINDSENCKRYVARVVTNVKIEQSPWWMQQRLMYAGMRPINNIVDITNFVMLEYGHPIHAFDIRQIEDNKIILDRAAKGEKFTTLDEKNRTLTEEMLLVRDGKKAVAIAGVMGGLNSDVREDTTTILIEAANFNSDNIRKTSKTLGLRTEASSRFEKGVDPNLCREAADRVCTLIEELGAGVVQKGAVDVYPEKKVPWSVSVRVERVNKILGTRLHKDDMIKIFESLEMKVKAEDQVLIVTPPTVRLDLLKEIDFVEEVARMYGYDNLDVTLPKSNKGASYSKEETLRQKAKEVLCAMGANETQTYSFVSPKSVEKLGLDEDSWERNFVVLKNPLGEENSVMRTILTPGMLETLAFNYSRNAKDVKAFEIGTTFNKNLIEEKGLPDEQDSLVIGVYGENADFFTLKGMVVTLLEKLGVSNIVFEAEGEYPVYHPGRCARVIIKGGQINSEKVQELLEQADRKIEGNEEEIALMKSMVDMMTNNISNSPVEIGIMGEVHPNVAETYGIDTKCYICEIMFTTLCEFAQTKVSYKPLPKYPSTARDIALLVDEEIEVGQLQEVIQEASGELLESVKLFDVYRGKQVKDGKKSVAFNLTYRGMDKTLTDEEVTPLYEKVLKELKEKLNAILREM